MAVSFGRQFQVVFEHSPIGIVIMDGVGRIQYANNAVRTFLGYDDDQIVGGFLTRFAYQDDSEFFQTLFAELVEGERDDFQVVSRYKRKNGDPAWWRVDMRAVKTTDQSPFMIAVVDDVTSQKNDEERLRRGKELAEAATRTKSAFLANMSHEIRTPLHTINAVAELMRETKLDEEQIEYLEQITFAGEVLLGLINDILDFSKIEAGRLQLESIDFNPVETLEDAVEMVSLQAHRKGLEVVLAVESTIPSLIKGDPNRIRQVLVNLVNNASKFTGEGQIRIDVQQKVVQGAPNLLVQVKDTGIGIEPEVRDRLFKPFSQVDASMTRKFGGTGLGLSISRDLVNMMNGRIGVKSSPGKGSNFWFSLPMNVSSSQKVAVTTPRSLAKGSRFLVIDDNIDSIAVIRSYLEDWGYAGETVTSTADGIALLVNSAEAGTPYDFVLIDLILPGMDGWQLASEIRNDERLKKIPLILMTPVGMSTGEAKMKLLRWFDAYISKPVKRNDLATSLEGVFASDLEELEMVDGEKIAGAGNSATGSPRSAYPEVILVAEDHFVNQQLFQTILQKRGFRTLLAADGMEAVEMVKTHPEIGLIFMDVQMPNLNGYDATVQIRELGVTTPIVAVTANALSGDRDRCVRVGMNDYMSKPFKNTDISAVLERLLHSGAFESNAESAAQDLEPEDLEPEELEPEELEPEELEPEAEPAPLMDVAAAVEAFMGDVETTRRVTLSFADRLPSQVQTVRDYLAAEKVADARIVAHAIKGGAWNLSCSALGDAARIVEDMCASGEVEKIEPALQQLQEQVDSLVVFIRAADFDV